MYSYCTWYNKQNSCNLFTKNHTDTFCTALPRFGFVRELLSFIYKTKPFLKYIWTKQPRSSQNKFHAKCTLYRIYMYMCIFIYWKILSPLSISLSLYTPVSLSHDQLNIKTLDLQHTSGFYMAVFVWGLNSQYEKLGHSLDHDRIITITISWPSTAVL